MKDMTTAQILAEYNALTGQDVKKFASRAVGEKRLAEARAKYVKPMIEDLEEINLRIEDDRLTENYGTTTCPHCGVHLSNGVGYHGMEDGEGKKIKLEKHEYYCMGCGGEFGPELKTKNIKLSDAIAESWNDPVVTAKRTTRNKVTVNGTEFKSVRDAFAACGLPMGKHIKFRMSLKETQAETFEFNGTRFDFKIVIKED